LREGGSNPEQRAWLWIASLTLAMTLRSAQRRNHRHLERPAIGGGMFNRLVGVVEIEACRFELVEVQ